MSIRPNRNAKAATWSRPTIIMALLLVLVILLLDYWQESRPLPDAPEPSADGYLFCVWNVENLFDDTDDPKNHDPLDAWFASDPQALAQKHTLLADVLLGLNDGRGPDILALIEVENRRAVELLQDAINTRLPTEWQYTQIAHVDDITGRRIEPAILTRLPVRHERTRQIKPRRILEAHLEVNDEPLIILASHWTSRVTDLDGSKRLAYAQVVYDTYLEHERADPGQRANVLIVGDFNDEPDDDSLRLGLRVTGSPDVALASAGEPQPRPLNLMIGLDPKESGTYLYRNRWQILDHIVASPGLLDNQGWTIRPETLKVVNPPEIRGGTSRAPLRFGNPDNPNLRGPSDHFAVTVRLLVDPANAPGLTIAEEIGDD